MIKIISSKNQVIKSVKSLKLKKNRDESNKFFIEGSRFFEEAMNSDVKISRIFFSESFASTDLSKNILENDRLANTLKYLLADKIFDDISDTETPQGILAVIEKPEFDENRALNEKFIIFLDAVRDPGNLGTIIRTADAAGVGAVILSSECADIYNPKTLRSTMGSIFHVPTIRSADSIQTLKLLKSNGSSLIAADLKGEKNYFETDLTGKVVLIIGNEANGISREILKQADSLIKIPMPGAAESLNASIAAAIIAFERVRQSRNQ